MQEITNAFRRYCIPKKNIVFERHQFWSHSMAEGVSVDKFVTELRQRCKNCEFGAGENDMIRDKLVFSLPDTRMKEILLRETDLTLDKAVDICRAAEAAKSQLQAMGTRQREAPVQALSRVTATSDKGHTKAESQIRQVNLNGKNPVQTRAGSVEGHTSPANVQPLE